MKTLIRSLLIAALFAPAMASAEVGVSVSIGQPGFYGRIDIGDYPRPRLIYDEPRIIVRERVGSPLYLHVPPGHARDWGKHCRHYNACARPVYFVDNGWYEETYVPAYRARHGRGHERGGDHGHDKGNGHGNKNGKNKGHGKD